MAADVEAIAFVFDRTADPADVGLVLFDDRHAQALLGQQIAGRQSGGARPDNRNVDSGFARLVGTRDILDRHLSPLRSGVTRM